MFFDPWPTGQNPYIPVGPVPAPWIVRHHPLPQKIEPIQKLSSEDIERIARRVAELIKGTVP